MAALPENPWARTIAGPRTSPSGLTTRIGVDPAVLLLRATSPLEPTSTTTPATTNTAAATTHPTYRRPPTFSPFTDPGLVTGLIVPR